MTALDDLEDNKYFPPGLALGAQHRADTVVTTHVDGSEYFAAIHQVIDSLGMPGDRLYITSWNLDVSMKVGPPVPSEPILADRLIRLAAAGVDVRVIVAAPRYSLSPLSPSLWDQGFFAFPWGQALRQISTVNIASVRTLRQTPHNGPPPLAERVLIDWGGGFDSRHEKCTVAYSSVTGELHAFVGGMDYVPDRVAAQGHLGTPQSNYWHDVGAHLRGGAAHDVLENFRTRWDETATLPDRRYWFGGQAEKYNAQIASPPPELTPPPAPSAPPAVGSHGDAGVRIWRSYHRWRVSALTLDGKEQLPWHQLPAQGVREVRTGIQRAIESATRYIYIEDQTLNPREAYALYGGHLLLYPVIRQACFNGVKVIFVTQGWAPNSTMRISDSTPAMGPEVRSYIWENQTIANFALFHRRDTKVHSKIVLVDDEFASIGSANLWDRSQLGWESEVNAAIVHPGGEASLVADLRVRLWAEHFGLAPGPDVRKLEISLGYFRDSWGTGRADPVQNMLVEMPR